MNKVAIVLAALAASLFLIGCSSPDEPVKVDVTDANKNGGHRPHGMSGAGGGGTTAAGGGQAAPAAAGATSTTTE